MRMHVKGKDSGGCMSSHDKVRAFITDPVLQQRLAKYLVLQCVRNLTLEDLHAGISPTSASGDYSDVNVSTPHVTKPRCKSVLPVSRLRKERFCALIKG